MKLYTKLALTSQTGSRCGCFKLKYIFDRVCICIYLDLMCCKTDLVNKVYPHPLPNQRRFAETGSIYVPKSSVDPVFKNNVVSARHSHCCETINIQLKRHEIKQHRQYFIILFILQIIFVSPLFTFLKDDVNLRIASFL